MHIEKHTDMQTHRPIDVLAHTDRDTNTYTHIYIHGDIQIHRNIQTLRHTLRHADKHRCIHTDT
jgi:hypothetical protein